MFPKRRAVFLTTIRFASIPSSASIGSVNLCLGE
jgi:hypothetical protein